MKKYIIAWRTFNLLLQLPTTTENSPCPSPSSSKLSPDAHSNIITEVPYTLAVNLFSMSLLHSLSDLPSTWKIIPSKVSRINCSLYSLRYDLLSISANRQTTIGTALINQIQPRFFFLRDLYEIRERPSKIYHWLAFLVAAILAEIPWNLLVGTLFFFGWYFPVGFWKNVTVPADRAAFQWLFLMVWELFVSTFAQFLCSFVLSSYCKDLTFRHLMLLLPQ